MERAAASASLKLLLDAMYELAIAEQLRIGSVDALAAQAIPELRDLDDDSLFALAQLDGRCVVTENAVDYVRVESAWRASRRELHYGVLLTSNRSLPRHGARFVGQIVRAIESFLADEPEVRGILGWLQAVPR